MTTKKITKIICVLLLIATIFSAVSVVFASNIPSAVDLKSGGTEINSVAGRAIRVAQYVCYAAAVIMLMVLGIKFITAAPEAKAAIQKSAVYYLVGALLVFAAGAILGVIAKVGDSGNFAQ